MVKNCPCCGLENNSKNKFCIGCAASFSHAKNTVPFLSQKVLKKEYRVIRVVEEKDQVSDFFGGDGDSIFIETVSGATVESILEKDGNPGLAEEKVVIWIKEILHILRYLHSQTPSILYKHISPSNIIITDYGCARLLEQGRGSDRGIDFKTDINSLGKTMYFMLTGVKYDDGFTRIPPAVSPALANIIMKSLDRNRTFSSAFEFQQSLDMVSLTPSFQLVQSNITSPLSSRVQENIPPAPPVPVKETPSRATTISSSYNRNYSHPVSLYQVQSPISPVVTIKHYPPSSAKTLSYIKIFFLIFFIALLAGGFFGGKEGIFRVWSFWGRSSYEEGNYDKALEYYDKALGLKPESFETWDLRGLAFFKKKKFAEAMDCFNKSLELNPEYVDALVNKGNVLQNEKKYEEAIECYDKALKYDEKNTAAWYNRGCALGVQGRYEEAIGCYVTVTILDPKHYPAWHNKGFALTKEGKYEEAVKSYTEALNINPYYAEAWYNKGYALSQLWKYQEAITCYDEALRIKPDYSEASRAKKIALYNQGESFYKKGEYKEAAYRYEKALEIDPGFTRAKEKLKEALYKLGNDLCALGKYEEGFLYFDQALALDPKFKKARNKKRDILYGMGNKYYDKKDYASAIAFYDRVLEVDPTFKEAKRKKADAFYYTGNALYSMGQYADAATYYTQACNLFPDDLTYYRAKDNALRELEAISAAIKEEQEQYYYNQGSDTHYYYNYKTGETTTYKK